MSQIVFVDLRGSRNSHTLNTWAFQKKSNFFQQALVSSIECGSLNVVSGYVAVGLWWVRIIGDLFFLRLLLSLFARCSIFC